jgi:hypothetical protein
LTTFSQELTLQPYEMYFGVINANWLQRRRWILLLTTIMVRLLSLVRKLGKRWFCSIISQYFWITKWHASITRSCFSCALSGITPWRHIGTVLRFLNFCTRWSWEISFTLRPLYLRGNTTRHKTHRWFCGPRTRNRSCRQKTNLLATPERASTFTPCSVLPNHSTDSATLAHCYTVLLT